MEGLVFLHNQAGVALMEANRKLGLLAEQNRGLAEENQRLQKLLDEKTVEGKAEDKPSA